MLSDTNLTEEGEKLEVKTNVNSFEIEFYSILQKN